MGKIFFNGWELWQKMTFVLGACIFVVFCIAYGKLVWMNRYVERQEAIDEEKRAKIQQLRQNGQFVESPDKHDIPFGVRAIQSGVQVDGIWISKTTASIPHKAIPERLSGNKAENVQESEISHRPALAFDEKASSFSKATRLSTGKERSLGIGDSGSSFMEHIDDAYTSDFVKIRNSYHPQRFSHLRPGHHDPYHGGSQAPLSGNASNEAESQTHRPLHSRGLYADAESSAADNERDSGTSFDSDATSFEGNVTYAEALTGRRPISTKPYPGYFKVPTESPLGEILNPFANPPKVPLQSQRPHAQGNRASKSPHSSTDRTLQTYSQPLSMSSGLRSNNLVRNVNSGFENFRAGTFTAPASYQGTAASNGDRINDLSERQS